MAAKIGRSILLNYQAGVARPVQRTSLMDKPFVRERSNLLFVGEGNFSFTLAFAAYREANASANTLQDIGIRYNKLCSNPTFAHGWEGIVPTRYESEDVKPKPTPSDVKATCLAASADYDLSMRTTVEHPDQHRLYIELLRMFPQINDAM